MRAARLLSPSDVVFPLDQEAGDLLVGSRTLRHLQEEEAGVDVVDIMPDQPIPPGVDLAFAADAVFSRETIGALRQVSAGRLVRAAIRAGTPLWRAASRMASADGDLPLPLWAGPMDRAALANAPLVAVCDEDGAERIRVPPHGAAPHVLEIPAVTKLGGRIAHWLHALDLSLAALHTELARPRSAKLPGRNIHPTAYVENSILGAGVRVEAHASVINSSVGNDVLVADHSVIHGCVIGDRCRTLVDTSLRRIVAMPDSTLSNLGLADSIIGRNVFLTTAVSTFGPPPGETVAVDGVVTDRPVLGVAIGARAVLGARALLHAGVALPAGVLVVAKPDEAVGRFDDESLARANMLRGTRLRDV